MGHQILSNYTAWSGPPPGPPTTLTWQSKYFGPTVAQQSAAPTSYNPSGAGLLSATITSGASGGGGVGGVTVGPVPVPSARSFQVFSGASSSNPSGAGLLSATITSSGGGRGVTIVPVPSAGSMQVFSGASQSGPRLSDEKRREMKERMKRLIKGVKKLEEQLNSVDINKLTKLKKLMEIVKQVEKNDSLEFDEITIQKCEKAVKKFLQKSQQDKE